MKVPNDIKTSNNNIFIFFKEKAIASQIKENLKKRYTDENFNMIESFQRLSDAKNVLNKINDRNHFIDIIILDLSIPLSTRKEFIRYVRSKQPDHEIILVGGNVKLIESEKKFIESNMFWYVSNYDEVSIFVILQNIIDHKFKDKQLEKKLKTQPIIKRLIKETSKLKGIESVEEKKQYQIAQDRIARLDEIIKNSLEETGKIFEAKSGFVVLTNPGDENVTRKNEWEFGLELDIVPPYLEIGVEENGEVVFKRKKCIVGKVIADGKLYNCSNAAKDQYYLKYSETDMTKSQIVIPLKFQQQTFGAFALNSPYENVFSDDDAEILNSIATQIALLIKRFQYLNKLLDLIKPLRKIDNLEQLYDEIVERTMESLDTKVCYLRVLERNSHVIKAHRGIRKTDSDNIEIFQSLKMELGSISGKVAKSLKPVREKNVQKIFKDEYLKFAERNNLFGIMSVPITSTTISGKEELIGVLSTYANRPFIFTPLDLQLIQAIAEKAGEAVKKAKLIRQLGEIAKIDRKFTTNREQDVLINIADTAKKLLDADLVVLYRYDSKITENYGFSGNPTVSGKFKMDTSDWKPRLTKDSFIVLLSRQKSDKINCIESFEDSSFIKRLYSKRVNGKYQKKFYEREKLKSAIILKLIYRDKIVGILLINYRYLKSITLEDQHIAETFANKAAIAVSNIRKMEKLDETNRRIEMGIKAIQKSGVEIVEILNQEHVVEDDILKPVLDEALNLFDVDMGYIGLSIKKAKNTIIAVCSDRYALLKGKYLNHYYPEDTKWVKEHKEFDISPNENKMSDYKRFADDPDFYPEIGFQEDKYVKSALRVPIYSDKELLGMIVLESETSNAFSKIDAYAVMSLANQASIALQNYKLIDQLRKLREIERKILKGDLDLNEVLKIIIEYALDFVNKSYGDISMLSADGKKLEIVKSIPEVRKYKMLDVDDSICGLAVIKREFHYEPDIRNRATMFKQVQTIETLSELAIPLMVEEEIIGVLNLESEEVNAFTQGDIRILLMLAHQASIVINLAQTREMLVEKRREAHLGYITRESVHWVGNKGGPIKHRVEAIKKGLEEYLKSNTSSAPFFKNLKDNLEIIREATESLLTIKSDLIDSGKSRTTFDLIKLLNDCIKKIENENDLKNDIDLKISKFFLVKDVLYHWDFNHAQKIFYYILKNAVDAIEDKIHILTNGGEKKISWKNRNQTL